MVSVIIPAYNEAAELPPTLERIRDQTGAREVILVDGGSTDTTIRIATEAGARVLETAARNRARQMNAGAAIATGDALLFLHADTWLPRDGLAEIARALTPSRCVGGAFRRRFRDGGPFLAMTTRLADIRCAVTGWFLGDQAIFARTEVFRQVGGFREWPLFEDPDLSRRLRRIGRTTTLPTPVLSSARRFLERGTLRTTIHDFLLTLRLLSGAPPARLAAAHRRWKERETHRAPKYARSVE